MERKEDLEQAIHESHRIIFEYEQIRHTTDRPEERLRAERMIAEQSFAWLKRQRPTSGQTEKPPSYARGGVPVGVYDDLLRRVRLALPAETDKR